MTERSEGSSPLARQAMPLDQLLTSDQEEALAFRLVRRSVKYLAGVMLVLTTIAGYFGYHTLADWNKTLEEMKGEQAKMVKANAELLAAAERSRALPDSLIVAVKFALARFEVDSVRLRRQVQLAEEESRSQSARVARAIDAALDGVDARLRHVDTVAGRTNAARERADSSAEAARKQLGALAAERARLQETVTAVDTTIRTVRQRTLGSVPFVVDEQLRTPVELYNGVGLKISKAHQHEVEGVAVFEREGGRWKDEPVWGPATLTVGTPVIIRVASGDYRLLAVYKFKTAVTRDAAAFRLESVSPVSPGRIVDLSGAPHDRP